MEGAQAWAGCESWEEELPGKAASAQPLHTPAHRAPVLGLVAGSGSSSRTPRTARHGDEAVAEATSVLW